jgi:hypothetical protein
MRTHELDGRAPHHGRAGLYDRADSWYRVGCGAAALHPARANRRHGRLDCRRTLGSRDEPTDAARTHCRARNNYTTRNAAYRNAQQRLVRRGGTGSVSGLFALTPRIPLACRAGEGELQGALPCAPTPLSHSVGERLGVRAIRRGILSNIYRALSVRELPPSLRFPPLREGNRRGAVPPARRGILKEGFSLICALTNFGSAIGITRAEGGTRCYDGRISNSGSVETV